MSTERGMSVKSFCAGHKNQFPFMCVCVYASVLIELLSHLHTINIYHTRRCESTKNPNNSTTLTHILRNNPSIRFLVERIYFVLRAMEYDSSIV